MNAGSNSTKLVVKDAAFFYDGFGIPGEQGDRIQFQGQAATARIARIDYTAGTLTLEEPLTWQEGQALGLVYAGQGPDIGAFEHPAPADSQPASAAAPR